MTDDVDLIVEQAIRWALDKLGCGDYKLRCLGFVEDAYELGNGIVLDGCSFAKEAADAYNAAASTGSPPRGAYVFYDCRGEIGGERKNWGHVGLAVGDGQVIHAWGEVRIDSVLGVQELRAAGGWSQPVYLGWAPVSRVLQGATRK